MFLLSELLMLLVVKPLQPGVAFIYSPPPQKKKKNPTMFNKGNAKVGEICAVAK